MHNNLQLHIHKVQLLQVLPPYDKPRRKRCMVDTFDRLDEDENFSRNICFSDEDTSRRSKKDK